MSPVRLLNTGHIYLQRYKVIAVGIILFLTWQTHDLTEWYKLHHDSLREWQNAPVIGLITGYVAALKFALEHILQQPPSKPLDLDS